MHRRAIMREISQYDIICYRSTAVVPKSSGCDLGKPSRVRRHAFNRAAGKHDRMRAIRPRGKSRRFEVAHLSFGLGAQLKIGIIMNQRPCPRISPNAVIRFRRSGPHMHAFYIGTRCFSPFRHGMLRPHLRSGLECIRSKIGEAPPSVTTLLPASARVRTQPRLHIRQIF